MNSCKIIGLTGGVGAGKTFVALRAHEKYGLPIILADEVGHIALEPGRETYKNVVKMFGKEIVNEDGTINRKLLSNLVFSDKSKLSLLNSIVHPFIESYIIEQIERLKAETKEKYILLEAAILFESNLSSLCDEVWLVTAEEEIRANRLKIVRGYSNQKIKEIIKSQLSEKEMRERVDKIIINNGNLQEIDKQLEILLV